ncbi:MAG TPA: hypothetical protein VHG69_07170 [Thermoleophilaceae bacterium]|nr:hypothetical protein [Thermoleophilaceae bacterium]
MSSPINWATAQARSAEAKRLDSAPNAHPFALFVELTSRVRRRHR